MVRHGKLERNLASSATEIEIVISVAPGGALLIENVADIRTFSCDSLPRIGLRFFLPLSRNPKPLSSEVRAVLLAPLLPAAEPQP